MSKKFKKAYKVKMSKKEKKKFKKLFKSLTKESCSEGLPLPSDFMSSNKLFMVDSAGGVPVKLTITPEMYTPSYTAIVNSITIEDARQWKAELDAAGISPRRLIVPHDINPEVAEIICKEMGISELKFSKP